jgi:uncharacterized protein (UPF0264 family)
MLAHGADIIDLKDPSNGALGALARMWCAQRSRRSTAGGLSAVTGNLRWNRR